MLPCAIRDADQLNVCITCNIASGILLVQGDSNEYFNILTNLNCKQRRPCQKPQLILLYTHTPPYGIMYSIPMSMDRQCKRPIQE